MNLVTRIAGVVLATSAICGIGAGTALADTPAPSAGQHDAAGQVGKALYSRGFTVYNLSQHPMMLQQAAAPEGDNGSLDSGPTVDSIVQPGQSQHFEETYWFAKDSDVRVIYEQLKADGTPDYSVGEVYFDLSVDGSGNTSSTGNVLIDGDVEANANGTNDTITDPAGTAVTFTPDQQQAAAKTLEQLCQNSNQATCSFTPTSDDATGKLYSPYVFLTGQKNTDPISSGMISVERGQDFSTTDSWGISATVDTNIAEIVNASVSATYQHSWTTTSSFKAVDSHPVDPMTYGEIDERVPVERVTGDFQATMGNTTFHFTGISFDSPIPGGQPDYGYFWHPLDS